MNLDAHSPGSPGLRSARDHRKHDAGVAVMRFTALVALERFASDLSK